jgi:hypothetical protein
LEALAAHGDLDAIESRAASLASQLAGARLNAAAIDHERRHAIAQTDVQGGADAVGHRPGAGSSVTRHLERRGG